MPVTVRSVAVPLVARSDAGTIKVPVPGEPAVKLIVAVCPVAVLVPVRL